MHAWETIGLALDCIKAHLKNEIDEGGSSHGMESYIHK